MYDLELITLILSAIFLGGLVGGLMIYLSQHRRLSRSLFLTCLLPVYLRNSAILGILAGLAAALAGLSFESFVLAITAMSLIFSRIHLLRLATSNLTEAQHGDQGAMRMYRFNMVLLTVLLIIQILASLWVLILIGGGA